MPCTAQAARYRSGLLYVTPNTLVHRATNKVKPRVELFLWVKVNSCVYGFVDVYQNYHAHLHTEMRYLSDVACERIHHILSGDSDLAWEGPIEV